MSFSFDPDPKESRDWFLFFLLLLLLDEALDDPFLLDDIVCFLYCFAKFCYAPVRCAVCRPVVLIAVPCAVQDDRRAARSNNNNIMLRSAERSAVLLSAGSVRRCVVIYYLSLDRDV